MAPRRTTSKAQESGESVDVPTAQKKSRGRPRSAAPVTYPQEANPNVPVAAEAPAHKSRPKKLVVEPEPSVPMQDLEAKPTTSKSKLSSKLPRAQSEAPTEVPATKSKRQSKAPKVFEPEETGAAAKPQSKSQRTKSVIPISIESEEEPTAKSKRGRPKAKKTESVTPEDQEARPASLQRARSNPATKTESRGKSTKPAKPEADEATDAAPKKSAGRKPKKAAEPKKDTELEQKKPEVAPAAAAEPKKKRGRPKSGNAGTSVKPEAEPEAAVAEPATKAKRGRPKAKAPKEEPKPRAEESEDEKPELEEAKGKSKSARNVRVKKTKPNTEEEAAASTPEEQPKSKRANVKKQEEEAVEEKEKAPKGKRTLLSADRHVEFQSPKRSDSKSTSSAAPAAASEEAPPAKEKKRTAKRHLELEPEEPAAAKKPTKSRGRPSKQPSAEPETEAAPAQPQGLALVQPVEEPEDEGVIAFVPKKRKPTKLTDEASAEAPAAAAVAAEEPYLLIESIAAPAPAPAPAPAQVANLVDDAASAPAPESKPKRGRKPASASASPAKAEKKKAPKQTELEYAEIAIARLPRHSGQVLCVGTNSTGQLGVSTDVDERTRPQPARDLPTNIAFVAAGAMHSLAISEDGATVYSWGLNDEGALGRVTGGDPDDEADGEAVPLPVQFPQPETVVMVAAGDSHSAALTADGRVFLWGVFHAQEGTRLGLVERSQEPVKRPVELAIEDLAAGEKIASIASGAKHLVLLSTRGRVFTLGNGLNGQLGRIPAEQLEDIASEELLQDMLRPSALPLKEACIKIGVCEYSTLMVTNRCVWGCGLNNFYQLGFRTKVDQTICATPTIAFELPNEAPVNWVQIIGGLHHVIGLTSNGEVFVCGRHEYGRLGLGPVPAAVAAAANAATAAAAAAAAAATAAAAERLMNGTLADPVEDVLPAEPTGAALPPAEPHKCDAVQPTRIVFFDDNEISVRAIAAGQYVSFAIDQNGRAYSWGQAHTYQLAQEGENDDSWVPKLMVGKHLGGREVYQIAGGTQHTILLVSAPSEEPAAKKARLSNGTAAVLEADGAAAASGSQATRQETAARAPDTTALATLAPSALLPVVPLSADAFSASAASASAPKGPVTPTPTPHASQPQEHEHASPKTNGQSSASTKSSPGRLEVHMQLDADDALQGELLAIEPADDEPASSVSLPIFAPPAAGADAAESDSSASVGKSARPASRP